MKTVSDFLGQLWLRFLKPNGPITIPHQTEGKAKRFSDNNSILQKSLETFLQEIIEFRFNLLSEGLNIDTNDQKRIASIR